MNHVLDDEDLALPLVRRTERPRLSVSRSRAIEAEDDVLPVRHDLRLTDRFAPSSAGALAGFVAGAAALGVVHAMHPTRIPDGALRLASTYGIPADAALPLAYLAAALFGAMVGAIFASVTQHLRRLVPLLVWAEIFFVSLTTLALATSITYAHGWGASMAPAILAASAVFAFLASFQLKLRVRSAAA